MSSPLKYHNSLLMINAQDKSPIFISNNIQRFVVRLLPFYIIFPPAIIIFIYLYLFIINNIQAIIVIQCDFLPKKTPKNELKNLWKQATKNATCNNMQKKLLCVISSECDKKSILLRFPTQNLWLFYRYFVF